MTHKKKKNWKRIAGILTGLATLIFAVVELLTYLGFQTEDKRVETTKSALEIIKKMDAQLEQSKELSVRSREKLEELDSVQQVLTAAIRRKEERLEQLKRETVEVTHKTQPVYESPLEVGQVWNGMYVCIQGSTLLSLRITAVANSEKIEAVFEFEHTLSRVSGEFSLQGRYDPAMHTLNLVPKEWIKQPSNYNMVGMEGTISPEGHEYVGKISNELCSGFRVVLAR